MIQSSGLWSLLCTATLHSLHSVRGRAVREEGPGLPRIRITGALGGRLFDGSAKGEATAMDSTNIRNGAVTAVTQVVTLELIDAAGAATPLQTKLSFDPRDPFAVSATFLTVGGDVRWTFGRDLLIGGLVEPTGDGDVHVWPCTDNDAHPVVIIELCS